MGKNQPKPSTNFTWANLYISFTIGSEPSTVLSNEKDPEIMGSWTHMGRGIVFSNGWELPTTYSLWMFNGDFNSIKPYHFYKSYKDPHWPRSSVMKCQNIKRNTAHLHISYYIHQTLSFFLLNFLILATNWGPVEYEFIRCSLFLGGWWCNPRGYHQGSRSVWSRTPLKKNRRPW